MESEVTISTVVFIVMLIVPGVFFKRFYFRGQFTKQFTSGLFADRLITSIFWGLIVQLITFLLFTKVSNLSYEDIKKPVSGSIKQIGAGALPDLSSDNLSFLLLYISSSIVISAILGYLAHSFIRFFKIDSKFEVFRFSNNWNYYFRGDNMDFGEFKGRKTGKVLSTTIDIVMDNGAGDTKMFTGFITQYQISSETGALEVLYLTDAHRYSRSQQTFNPVDGDCLVVPYSKVIDMNIRYNVKVVNNTFYKRFISAGIALLTGAVMILILIFPWFSDLTWWRILIGIIDSIATWILFVALLNDVLSLTSTNARLDNRGRFYLILLLLLFGISSLSLLGLINIIPDPIARLFAS